MALNLTKENYKEIVNGELPVIIDFWAPWCGPCKTLAPAIEDLATEYADKIVICKCNVVVDDNEDIAAEFNIRNVPTLVFLQNGKEVDRTVGMMTKDKIEEKMQMLS